VDPRRAGCSTPRCVVRRGRLVSHCMASSFRYFEFISKGSSPGLMSADAYHWDVHCILFDRASREAVGQRRGMLLALLEPPPIMITNWHIEASSCDRVHDIQGTVTRDQFILHTVIGKSKTGSSPKRN